MTTNTEESGYRNAFQNFYIRFNEAAITGASAGTSVVMYHPFRTMAVSVITGKPLEWSFMGMYRGFSYSAAAAHQLFIMGFMEEAMRKKLVQKKGAPPTFLESMAIGAFSGAISSFTVIPCEVATLRLQMKQRVPFMDVRTMYRGFTCMVGRQTGLGACMFSLPQAVVSKVREEAPEFYKTNERAVKIGANFFGGSVGALATQVFEVGRTLHQADCEGRYPTARSALKQALREMTTAKGGRAASLRIGIIAVATLGMNGSYEIYSYLLKIKEGKK